MDDEGGYWDASEITSSIFNDDLNEDNASSTPNDDLFLSDLLSGTSLSNKGGLKKVSVDLYSLVSKKSVQYILNQNKSEDVSIFTPRQTEKHPPSMYDPKCIIDNMCSGKSVNLGIYKSLDSKKELLKFSLEKKNNNVILRIILFLVNTLKPMLVNEVLLTEPKIFDIYINFLISKGDITKAVEFYNMLGHNCDAGMLQYCLHSDNKNNMIPNLKSISNSYFLMESDKKYFDCAIQLLEWQLKTNKVLFQTSAIESLSYLIQTSNENITPESFCQLFNISKAQYHWLYLKEKSDLKQWQDISKLLISESLIGRKSLSTNILPSDIVQQLAKCEAPETEISKYLQMVTDIDYKLSLCKKYGLFHIAVDLLVKQKDRLALLLFKSEQPAQSASYFYAENALRSNSVKWKN